jgi:lipoate-protein ligase B
MVVEDLGLMAYREAWERQECAHEGVVAGGEDRLLLVEHPAVITFGRRAEAAAANLLASRERLAEMGVEVVVSDRGGDITFHGPGQLVVYPIVRLNEHGLSVGGYVRKLEEIVIAALSDLNVSAKKDEAIGVWVEGKKICALGVRIKRGVSLHGVALNVSTDLRYFDLIVPCGLAGKGVTSLEKVLGRAPAMEKVKRVVVKRMTEAFE